MRREDADPTETQADESSGASQSELEARCAEFEARWLRTQADLQNVRRRAQQELESALLRTLQPLLDELLLVSDYLDMALAAPVSTPEAKALAAGVSMTRAKLAQALELADVRTIPTTGLFDPSRHEAGDSRANADVAPGTILATLRPGYTWQGRILRPARVLVATVPSADADES